MKKGLIILDQLGLIGLVVETFRVIVASDELGGFVLLELF
jgi:hypothetical protein